MNSKSGVNSIAPLISSAVLIALFLMLSGTIEGYFEQNPNNFFALPKVEKKKIAHMPKIEAEVAVVYDTESGKIIFSKSSDKIMPLASLAKIMTAVVAMENHETDNVIKFTENGSKSTWKLSSFIERMLMSSSNSAAAAIARMPLGEEDNNLNKNKNNFVDIMNAKAKELNLKTLHFRNPTGLDVSESIPGAEGSSEDVAKMIWYAANSYNEEFIVTQRSKAKFSSIEGKVIQVMNTNRVAKKIPLLLVSKTGLTDLAGGNLAIVFDAGINHPMVAVVMGSTESGRFNDIQKLVNATSDYFASNILND